MKIDNHILEDIKNCYFDGEKTLLSFSAGPDSTFLFYILLELKKQKKIDFQIFYLNHMVRETAVEEEKYAFYLSEKFNIKARVERFNIKEYAKDNKISFEEAGRAIRYKLLEEIREKENLDSITTAHNADDNIENFFLRLFKGSGLSGLSPIKKREGKLVRPIIEISKNFILKFLNENNIKYFTDETNIDIKYERNKIRNIIIPVIQKNFPNFSNKIKEIQNIIDETREYMEKNSFDFMIREFEIYKNIEEILKYDDIIIKISILKGLKKLNKNYYISYKNLNKLVEEIKKWNFTGHKIVLKTKEYSVILSYKNLFIIDNTLYEQTVIEETEIAPGEEVKLFQMKIKNNFVSSIKLKKPIKGQKIKIKGKTKKIQDFMVDNKIDYHYRQKAVLISYNDDIKGIIIPHINFYKIFDSNEKIIISI